MRHATVVGNRVVAGSGLGGDGESRGGGIHLDDNADVGSSLFENNTATVGGTTVASPCDDTVFFTSMGHNVLADPSATCAFDAPTDQVGVATSTLPLDDYGCATPLSDGSCLLTHAIDLGTPAVDQGSCTASGVTADARSMTRPVDLTPANADDGCDVGAYEARDVDVNGIEDGFELTIIFTDGFESGTTSAWSNG